MLGVIAASSAPGRIELLGNHTDYNQGLVLGAAIDRALTLSGRSRSDDRILLRAGDLAEARLSNLQPRKDGSWANYPLGVVQQFIRAGYELRGFEAEISGVLPAGVGLGSSAAFEVATAGLLMKLFHLRLDPLEVARLCRRAENEFAGVQSGLLDQVTSIFGRADHLVHLDCRTEEIRTVPFPAGFALVIADTGLKHELLTSQYNERRTECAAAAEALGAKSLRDVSWEELEAARHSVDPILHRRAAHIVGENERVRSALEALRRCDIRELGALMNASHESSRTNFENSTPELDRLVATARSLPGVLGSRLTGGGFGGATVSLVEAARVEEVVLKLKENCASAFACKIADGAVADGGVATS